MFTNKLAYLLFTGGGFLDDNGCLNVRGFLRKGCNVGCVHFDIHAALKWINRQVTYKSKHSETKKTRQC